ncbi:hypothetical protein HYFRA_00000312 [Hymenoscyphus fraxineus]|uniref:CCHC-type domain-containing protein n=1 Tax=Hymenoscyphus fraxineus TaxID=746836 RepID=A0A9N9L2M1_9HELO|nr:hypothetical protein HYFRA_00000312 [Hymenoscyphus fraxineus]
MELDTDTMDDSRTSLVGRKRDLHEGEALAMKNSEQASPESSTIPAGSATKGDGETATTASKPPVDVSSRADGEQLGSAPPIGGEIHPESASAGAHGEGALATMAETTPEEGHSKTEDAATERHGNVEEVPHTSVRSKVTSLPTNQPPLYPFDTEQGRKQAGTQAQNRVPAFGQDNAQSPSFQDGRIPSTSGWNSGVQPGLRTSFGSKRSSRAVKSSKQPQVAQPKEFVVGEIREVEIANNSPNPLSTASDHSTTNNNPQAPNLESVPAEPPTVSLEKTLPEASKMHQEEPFESVNAGTRSKSLEALTADVDLVLAYTKFWPLPHSWTAANLVNTGKTFYPAPARELRKFQHHGESFATPLMLNELGMPYKIQDFSFNIFAPAFLRQNLAAIRNWELGDLRSAFHCYQNNWYFHLPKLQPILLATSRAAGHLTFEEAMELARDDRAVVKTDTKPSAQVQQNPLLPKTSRISSSPTDKSQSLVSSTSVTIDLTGEFTKGQGEDVRMTDALSSATPMASTTTLSAEEMRLQRRYFPADGNDASICRCLACGDTGHKVENCPALSCELCLQVGKHSSLTCPSSLRCSKCRQRGHKTVNCPEKLSARAESSSCEICGSQEHLEEKCHFIWRSFVPKQEEIRVVRDIPIHCYQCGADGHYGPACGLTKGSSLSSDHPTWSLANHRKYVDPTSVNRALSAGVDYSIPKSNQKEFSIKGKGRANDPFTIEDSDDEADFIRPKINKPSTQRGHIQFNEPSKTDHRAPNEDSYRPQYHDYHDSDMRFNVQSHIQDPYSQGYQPNLAPIHPPIDQFPNSMGYNRRKRGRSNSPNPGPPESSKKQKKKKKAQSQQANTEPIGSASNLAPASMKPQKKLNKKARKRELAAKTAAKSAGGKSNRH